MVTYENEVLKEVDGLIASLRNQSDRFWPPHSHFIATRLYSLKDIIPDQTMTIQEKEIEKCCEEYLALSNSENLITPFRIDIVYKLKDEILHNLTCFARDRQELHYLTVLTDVLTHLEYTHRSLFAGCKLFRVFKEQSPFYTDKYKKELLGIEDYISDAVTMTDTLLQVFYPILKPAATINEIERDVYNYGSMKVHLDMPTQYYFDQEVFGEQLTDVGIKFQWKGDKTDLAELVWALAKSGRIGNTITGQSATQREITQHFETLFDLTLDVPGLMKGRMKTYKATSDGNTFTKTLSDLVNERAANS